MHGPIPIYFILTTPARRRLWQEFLRIIFHRQANYGEIRFIGGMFIKQMGTNGG